MLVAPDRHRFDEGEVGEPGDDPGCVDPRYYLHPLDREYALARIPAGDLGDALTAFTLAGLQARAADYYAQIRTPRRSWRTLEDVRPQLAEFGLRCDTGDYALAAADALLALADRNVDALEVRALALSGLAVVAGDPAQAAEAAQAFARANTVTRAPGVVADTRRLFEIITAHDPSGLLTAIGSESES